MLSSFLALALALAPASAAPKAATTVSAPAESAPAPAPPPQTDYTAYTLEWGETRVGLGGVSVGVLPRVQLAVAPALFAVGAPNVGLKATFVHAGSFDLAAEASGGTFGADALSVRYLAAGGSFSAKILPAWSVHGGARWNQLTVEGTPTIGELTAAIGELPLGLGDIGMPLDTDAQVITGRVATDVRVGKKERLVFQAHSVLWADLDLPPVLDRVGAPEAGTRPVTETWLVSGAWQRSWRNVDLRVGFGWSSIPGAWLFETVDLSWRFGGPTRAAERKARRG
jgi:hypothetical protein